MAVNSRTYDPVQIISITAGGDLAAFRFVSHAGQLCAAGAKSMGVTEISWLSGEKAAIVTLGTIAVETSGAIAVGDSVSSDADGKAKTLGPGEELNGRALSATAGAGFITIQLIP